jgi:1,4-alpha-glucan branching enzyme
MKKHSSLGLKPPEKRSIRHSSASQPAAGSGPADEAVSPRVDVVTTLPAKRSGAMRAPSGGTLQPVRLGYFQPDAREVFLVGSFNNWNPRATPLRRDALGDWSVELALPRGEYRYRLMVDGEWRDDPSAQQTAMNPFGGFDAVLVV